MKLQPQLKARRVLASLLTGAFIGAAIFCVQYLIGLYDVNGVEHFKEYAVSKAIKVFIPAIIVWFIAICVFGGPIWVLLHRIKRTHWHFVLPAGFLIPFIIVLGIETGWFTGDSGLTSYYANGRDIVIDGRLTPFGWKAAFFMALEYALIGTIITFVIWRMNYRTKSVGENPV